MGKRGPKPKGKVELKWTPNFAYAIGLIVSDGSLSKDGRHIAFVSKDIDMVKTFLKCMKIESKIGQKTSGYQSRNKCYVVQIGDVLFYNLLLKIGLMPNKSKIIGKINIPDKYICDFLRGSFDGDGSFNSYWDPRWRSSHMFYLNFSSASLIHINWIKSEIMKKMKVCGHISKSKRIGSIYNLRFAKKEALVIIGKMYYNSNILYLKRKKDKIDKALNVEKKQQIKYNITNKKARVLEQ